MGGKGRVWQLRGQEMFGAGCCDPCSRVDECGGYSGECLCLYLDVPTCYYMYSAVITMPSKTASTRTMLDSALLTSE